MITKFHKLFLVGLFAIALFNGCRQTEQVTKRYYVIEIPSRSVVNTDDTLNTINKYCEVRPVNISPPYASQRIAIREDTHEIDYFSNHEWAIRPSNNLTSIIVDFFEKYNVFKGISTRYWKIMPDFQLETTIYHMQLVNRDNKLSAHLNLELRLIDNQTDELLLKHTADNYQELDKNNINLFAMAISEMFYKEIFSFSKIITSEIQ